MTLWLRAKLRQRQQLAILFIKYHQPDGVEVAVIAKDLGVVLTTFTLLVCFGYRTTSMP